MWGKRADMVIHQEEPFNAEPPRAALAGRLITKVDTFYARNHGPIPAVDPATWKLRVQGRVVRPSQWTLEELREQFDEHELPATCSARETVAPG